jgi:hypothetical protein
MTITDVYLLGKQGIDSKHPLKKMTVKDFAVAVAYDLVHVDTF